MGNKASLPYRQLEQTGVNLNAVFDLINSEAESQGAGALVDAEGIFDAVNQFTKKLTISFQFLRRFSIPLTARNP